MKITRKKAVEQYEKVKKEGKLICTTAMNRCRLEKYTHGRWEYAFYFINDKLVMIDQYADTKMFLLEVE